MVKIFWEILVANIEEMLGERAAKQEIAERKQYFCKIISNSGPILLHLLGKNVYL